MIINGLVMSETCREESKECHRRSKCKSPRANCSKIIQWLGCHDVNKLHKNPETYYVYWNKEIEAEVRRLKEMKS
jgi:hypothetical protein